MARWGYLNFLESVYMIAKNHMQVVNIERTSRCFYLGGKVAFEKPEVNVFLRALYRCGLV